MPEKKKTQKTETKRRKQQPVSKRKQETTVARAKGSLEKSTAKNVKFDAPRLHVPNPRRIQRQSKLYAIFIAVLFIVLGIILFLMLFTSLFDVFCLTSLSANWRTSKIHPYACTA